ALQEHVRPVPHDHRALAPQRRGQRLVEREQREGEDQAVPRPTSLLPVRTHDDPSRRCPWPTYALNRGAVSVCNRAGAPVFRSPPVDRERRPPRPSAAMPLPPPVTPSTPGQPSPVYRGAVRLAR